MKKERGFTLIELVAVIILLSAIILVSVPVIINTLQKSEDKSHNDFTTVVANAAQLYVERNRDRFPQLNNINGSTEIQTTTLIEEGYLRNTLKDQNGDSVTNYKVVISVDNNGYLQYEIVTN